MSKVEIETVLRGGDVDNVKTSTYGLEKALRYKWKNGVVPFELDASVSKLLITVLPLHFIHEG